MFIQYVYVMISFHHIQVLKDYYKNILIQGNEGMLIFCINILL